MMGIIFFSSLGLFFDIHECYSCNDNHISLNLSDNNCDCHTQYYIAVDGPTFQTNCCTHEKIELSLIQMTTPPSSEQITAPKLKIVAEINQFHFDQYDDELNEKDNSSPPLIPGKTIVRHIKKSHPILFDTSNLV